MSDESKSKKCEHGRMPWECADCTPSVQVAIVDECIEAVKSAWNGFSRLSDGTKVIHPDDIDIALKQVRRKYE